MMRLKKKLLVAMLLGAAVGASVFAFSGCTDPNESEPPKDTDITEPDVPLDPGGCKHAGVTHVPAVGAQCEEGGNKEYWFCDDCDKYFADEELTVETSLAAVTLGALGHSYGAWVNEDPASCTEDGVKGHKDCSVCKKHFDAENNEIADLVIAAEHNYGTWVEEVPAQGCTDGVSGHYYCAACETYFNEDKEEFNGLPFPMGTGSLVIKAPHNIKHVSAKEETCTEDGNDEYYQCKDCHKYFVNEFAAMEAEAPMTYPATGHDYPADFTYNYATKQYEKVCANDHSHVITQAAGTEAYPYLANDEATLSEAIALGAYIKVENDFALQEVLTLNNDTRLNLNGCTITITAATTRPFTVGKGVAFTVENGNFVIPEENDTVYGVIDVPDVDSKLVVKDVTLSGNTNVGALIRVLGNNADITLDNVTATTNYLVLSMSFVSGKTLSGNLVVKGGEYNLIEKDSVHSSPDQKSNFFAGFNIWSNSIQDVSILTAEFSDVVINTVSRAGVSVSASTVVYNNCTIGNAQENADYGYLNSAISTSWAGKVTVNGGTYKAKYAAYVFSSGGTIEINGGKFIGDFKCDTAASDNSCAADAVINVNKCDSKFDWNGNYTSSDLSATYDCIFNNAYAGSEAYPYLISSEAEWVSFAAEHDESTVTTEAEDVYYKVTNNLDFTDVTERVDVFNFTGTIDFDGHSVKGITQKNAQYWYGATTGLFVLVHDATIMNLNYELAYYGSANALAFPVLFAWRGDVLLDNVTVSGNATHASNNGAAFVYFAWANAYNSSYVNPDAANNDYVAVAAAPIKLTFNNCTNYSNITNTGASATSGYAAAFVGQVTGNSAGNTVEFKNCVNEGTITGYHFASMLMANQNCAANVNTLVVENCVNNGKIYAGIANGASLVVGDTTSGTRKEYNEENSGEGKVVNGANGVTANIAIETLAIGEDGNFVINEVEGATVYKMEFVFSVRDDVNLDENGKPLHWGTTNITIDVNADSKVKALEFVDFQDVTGYEKNEFGIYQTADGNNYVITQTNPELMDLRMLAQPTVYLTAYNADGEVVSVSTCYLADALKDNA